MISDLVNLPERAGVRQGALHHILLAYHVTTQGGLRLRACLGTHPYHLLLRGRRVVCAFIPT